MPDNENVTSRRESYLARLRKKHPDRKFEDDEEIFGQISDDSDELEKELETRRGYEKSISDMMAVNPESAQFLVDMHNGENPFLGLVRRFGPDIRNFLDDPAEQERIAAETKAYEERVSQNRRFEDEYKANLEKSLKELERFQQERGLTDEQTDEVIETLIAVSRAMIVGQFDVKTLDMVHKAMTHDADVSAASEEGRVAGRNERIEERLRKRGQSDGIPSLSGKNGAGASRKAGHKSVFDLAAED